MTLFLDVRPWPVGGELAKRVSIAEADVHDYRTLNVRQLQEAIEGRHVLIGTHGFHVNRVDGIACFSNWAGLLQLPPPSVFVGLLWPGDSIWLHGLDYPEEPRVADDTGRLIGPFLDASFGGAASISFASHSLGARVVLAAVTNMKRRVRRAIFMAGAIDDDCLSKEFRSAAERVGVISILASRRDEVLAAAFPLGNFAAGMLDAGHPWRRAALGRNGPGAPWPGNFQAPFEIPESWDFGHGDYLRIDGAPTPSMMPPVDIARDEPARHGWREAWTAAFASTRFR